MNEKKFSDVMKEDDTDYIDETISNSHKAKQNSRFNRRLVIVSTAVILVILLITCVATATGEFGTRIMNFFTSYIEPGTDYEQSGFDLDVAIEKIPMSDFSGEVQQVGSTIKQQFKDYKPYSSRHPGRWQADFPSYEKACEYIGFDKLKQIDLGLEEQAATLIISGDENGQISSITLETYYSIDDINVYHFSLIYTENFDEEVILRTRTTENVEYEESFYTNDNNKQCHIIDSTELESGYKGMDGYIVDDGVLYNLHIAYQKEDSEQAVKLIYLWADLF